MRMEETRLDGSPFLPPSITAQLRYQAESRNAFNSITRRALFISFHLVVSLSFYLKDNIHCIVLLMKEKRYKRGPTQQRRYVNVCQVLQGKYY